MSASKIKFREALGQYVEILRREGVSQVPLDRRARQALKKRPPAAVAPAPRIVSAAPAPVAVPAAAVAVASSAATLASESVPAGSKVERLEVIASRARVCQKCPHLAAARTHVVVGEGNPDAKLMFVGEAPGADEDKSGRPFVGRAGQTLTKMIEAMGLTREEVYIGNILKCRPDMPAGAPGNRKPTPAEMKTCMPYILSQIEIIEPKVIVALGATALEALLDSKLSISKLRGTFVEFRGIPLMPTFHPSYLLHNPTNETKRKVWEDLLQVMEALKMPINEKQRGFFLTPNR